MIVGHNEKLRVILPHDDAGAAGLRLVGLGAEEKVIALVDNLIVDGHNGGHGLLHDGGYIVADDGRRLLLRSASVGRVFGNLGLWLCLRSLLRLLRGLLHLAAVRHAVRRQIHQADGSAGHDAKQDCRRRDARRPSGRMALAVIFALRVIVPSACAGPAAICAALRTALVIILIVIILCVVLPSIFIAHDS